MLARVVQLNMHSVSSSAGLSFSYCARARVCVLVCTINLNNIFCDDPYGPSAAPRVASRQTTKESLRAFQVTVFECWLQPGLRFANGLGCR